jgi:hypothetical protein
MPWIWREVNNPSANSVVVDLKGMREGYDMVFNVYGLYICHNATSAKKYAVRTLREGTNETAHFFTILVPANSQPFVLDSDEPLVAGVGAFTGYYWEHFMIVAIDGGEPTLSIGVKIKGRWYDETSMRG